MGIQLQRVSKFYGEQAALDDVSFEAKPGEIIGLLGPNGAGKSTTMKMICGYIQQDSGSIYVDGMDVTTSPLDTRQLIGYLAEQNPIYLDMYVREFLQFNSQIHKISSSEKRIDEVIELTGLQTEQNKFINQLSKGYKQRVGLAQAILHDPPILILDEPISGLDPNQLVEIRSLIKQLGETKTVLFSSHILQEVEQMCDRLLVLNRGKLVMDGTIEDFNRNQSGQSVVHVIFEKQINVSSILKSNDKIKSRNPFSFSIQTHDPAALKKALFDLAVTEENRITELSENKSTMEDVFHSLTKEDK